MNDETLKPPGAEHKPEPKPQPKPGPKPDPENTSAGKEQAGEAGQVSETGGPKGPEPTRYGDWEKKGRCIDF